MPEEGVMLSKEEKLLTADEIVRLARLFVSQGVTKIRLTGGEPTVRKDLLRIVGEFSHASLDTKFNLIIGVMDLLQRI